MRAMRRKKEGGCWEGWWECGGRNGDREGESEKRRKSTVRRVWVVVVEQRVKSRDSSWAVPRVWEPSLPEAATGHSLAARQSPHASRPRANENPASRGSRRIYTNFSIVRCSYGGEGGFVHHVQALPAIDHSLRLPSPVCIVC